MIVDCQSCPVRGQRCADCVVSVLLAPPSTDLPLDAAERQAVTMFADAGMVTPSTAGGLRARREPWGAVRAVG